jgi:hypothetical protein
MMTRLIPFLMIAMIVTASCRDANQRHPSTSPAPKKKTEPPTPHSDTLTVQTRAAVFYDPDSSQIIKRKKEIGEQNFQIGLDDYAYYIDESITFLKENQIPVLETKDKKFIRFIRSNGDVYIIKKDTLVDLWGIFLFDPSKEPYKADETDMESEYKKYFNDK